MTRRVKLDFAPLSLEETAKRLQIPQSRAKKILALVGVDPRTLRGNRSLTKKTSRSHSQTVKATAAK